MAALFTAEALAKVRAAAEPEHNVVLVKHGDAAAILRPLAHGKLHLFGQDVDAKSVCNDDTIANPEEAEVYAAAGRQDAIFLLCPGTLDGDTNVVTLFVKGKAPATRRVHPPATSHRITAEALRRIAEELLP